MGKSKKKRTGKDIIFYILLSFFAIIWLIPIFTVFLTALKGTSDFYSGAGLFELPEVLQWSNFKDAWVTGDLGLYMKNGLIVCFVKVPLGIICSSLLAFALTRLKIPHSRAIFIFVLVGMMLPLQSVLIPLNILYSRLGLTNTYLCLILSYIGFGIPLGTLIFRGFFKGIPKELDEAAYIDGCGNTRLFINVILPLAKPAIATVFIIDFLNTWNEFMVQSVLITTDSMKTVPNGLMSFFGEFSVNYGLLNAGVLMTIIPVLIVYLVFQKYFVNGMAGAVKG
jgi:raffinose/stachyose/melibiose transport system permease protein